MWTLQRFRRDPWLRLWTYGCWFSGSLWNAGPWRIDRRRGKTHMTLCSFFRVTSEINGIREF